MNGPTKPFAEIIQSSLSSWRAQCWQWDIIPTYGTLVTISTGNRTIFGLVHDIQTGSADTLRTVFTYKKTEAELKRDHPHIFEFLQTTFTCITLGFQEKGRIHYQVVPEPPKIHAFVQPAQPDEIRQFFSCNQYLHTLFAHASNLFSIDELLLALLTHLSHRGLVQNQQLSEVIETFSLLTANDYRRLKLFLQRLQSITTSEPSSVINHMPIVDRSFPGQEL